MAEETQTTYYGYEQPGDPDFDSNSYNAIGDRDNRLSDSDDHHSVALTQSEREARFGVTGQSTGQAFEYNGAVYYDDDTAPESNRRVDIYSPSGPGRSGESDETLFKQAWDESEPDDSKLSGEELRSKYDSFLPDYPDQPAEEPQKEATKNDPQKAPLDTFKDNFKEKYPQIAKMSDDEITTKYLQPAFPNVPVDKLTTYAKNPNGQALLKAEEENDETPLEKFKSKFPKFVEGKSDDDILHYIHDTVDPSSNFDSFKEKVNPWKEGSGGAIQNIIHNSANNFLPAAKAKVWEDSGALWGLASGDLEKSVIGGMIGQDGLKKVEQWRNDNLGNLDFLKGFVNWMQGNKQDMTAAAEAEKKKIRPGWEGFAGTAAGTLVGAIPSMATTYSTAGGGSLTAAEEGVGAAITGKVGSDELKGEMTKRYMAWAMSLGASKGYVKAYEEGAKYPLLAAVKDGAVDATAAWMFNTPSGWAASGLGNILLNMDEDKIKAFFSGKPGEAATAVTATAIDGIFGVVAQYGHGEGAWGLPGDKIIPDAALHELEQARTARAEGDAGIQRAKDMVNRAFMLMPEDLQHKIVGDVITVTQNGALNPEALKAKVDQIPEPISPEKLQMTLAGINKKVEFANPDAGLFNTPGERTNPYYEQARKALGRKEVSAPKVGRPKKSKIQQQAEEQLGTPLETADQLKKAHAKIKEQMGEPVEVGLPEEPKVVGTDELGNVRTVRKGRSSARVTVREMLNAGGDSAVAAQKALDAGHGLDDPMPKPEEPAKPEEKKKTDSFNVFTDHVMWGNGHAPPKPKGGRLGDRGQLGAAINPIDIIRTLIEWDRDFTHEKLLGLRPLGSHVIPKELQRGWEGLKEEFPEFKSQTSMETAGRVAQANAYAEFETEQQRNEMFRRENFKDELTHGDLAARRSGYQKKFTKAQQLDNLMAAEEGRSTGDPIMDRMIEIWRSGYKMLNDAEQKLGMGHAEVLNYLYHLYDKDSLDNFNKKYFKGFGVPKFMKHREWMTYRQALEASKDPLTGESMVKPLTLDQEMLWGIRVWEHNKNKHIIYTLEDLEAQGKAFSTKQKDLPDGVEEWPKVRSPKEEAGSYYMHPDAYGVLRQAWFPDPAGFGDKVLSTWGKYSMWLKGATMIYRMAWSIAHEWHLPLLRVADKGSRMLGAPTRYSPKQWAEFMFLDVPTLGVGTMIKDTFKQRSLLDIYQSRRSQNDATPDEHQMLSRLLDSGFSAKLSHERELTFSNWLRENGPKWMQNFSGPAAHGFGVAHDWLTMQPVQRWFFGRMIPASKMASVLEGINHAEMRHPELKDPKNASQRLVILRSIQQKVDKRLGELNFHNIFWPKSLKDAGIGSFFSMGWQMGLIDYNGGVVKALTGNKFHLENVKDTLLQAHGKDMRWDALRFGGLYTMASMMQGAVQNYIGTGGPPTSWEDYFNPRTGRKRADGTEERWRTLNWPAETIAYYNYIQAEGLVGGTAKLIGHKLNPVYSAVYGAAANSDYLGRFIWDPHGPPLDNVIKVITSLVQESYLPLSGGSYAQAGKEMAQGKLTPQTTKEAFAAFFGSTHASVSAERTLLENKIMNQFHDQTGQAKWVSKVNELHFAYKQATDLGDKKGMQDAVEEMRKAGATDKQIENIKHDTPIPIAHRTFKHINAGVQAKFLMEMTDEERKVYLKLASPKGLKEYHKLKTHTSQDSGWTPEWGKWESPVT